MDDKSFYNVVPMTNTWYNLVGNGILYKNM